MKTTVNFTSARFQRDMDGPWLCLKIEQEGPAMAFLEDMKQGARYDAELSKHRNKRSTDANSYAWLLLDKLAKTLMRTKEDLYIDYVKQYGVFKDFCLTEEESKTFCKAWSMLGTGWPTEKVDYSPDGDKLIVRAYYGSSTYNTKQMSRLIDAIVEDCKSVGIETMTPFELDALKERWSCTK